MADWPSGVVQNHVNRVNVVTADRSVIEVAKYLQYAEPLFGCLNTDKEIP